MIYPLLYSRIGFLAQNFKTYSIFATVKKDSTVVLDTLNDSSSEVDTLSQLLLPPSYAGIEYLKAFYQKLSAANSQVRIAYYGDSAIEGDLISQTLRDSLQKRFGGAGVGFVPIYSPIAGFRNTINHHASDNWQTWDFGFKKDSPFSLGYGGEVFSATRVVDSLIAYPDSTAVDSLVIDSLVIEKVVDEVVDENYTVRYIASKRYAGVSTLANPYLYYGAPTDGKSTGEVEVTQFKKDSQYQLIGDKLVNRLGFEAGSRKISLSFSDIDSMAIYGMSFESKRGVIVDNLPARGNSAGWLNRLDSEVLKEFNRYLDVDLVILQYGLNVLNAKMKDYSWYKKEMKRVVAKMKQSYPTANILVIGPSDKATKIDGKMVSDPSVLLITEVMRAAAEESEVAFFSFYEAMGGEGAMVDWVEKKNPRWANLDYTHFNFKGAREAGRMLTDFLLEGWMQEKEGMGKEVDD